MPFMYTNPLFSLNLPTSSIVQYSEFESSDEMIEEMESQSTFTFAAPFSPIETKKSIYYKNKIKKFNYLNKGKKVKTLKI
jgi:hypothetical protein